MNTNNDTTSILQVKPVELAKKAPKLEQGKTVNRIKTERVTYFPDIKNRANRKFLSLEKPFVDALEAIAPSKEARNEWLNTVLASEPDHATAVVRNTLISTLLTKWV